MASWTRQYILISVDWAAGVQIKLGKQESAFRFRFLLVQNKYASPLQHDGGLADHRCFPGNPPPLLRMKVFLFFGLGMSWISITCIVLCFFAEREREKDVRDMGTNVTSFGPHCHIVILTA